MNEVQYDNTIEAVADRAIESLESDFGNEWWNNADCTISVTIEESIRPSRVVEAIETPENPNLAACGEVLDLSDNVGTDPSWRALVIENEDMEVTEAVQYMAFSSYREDVYQAVIERLDQREKRGVDVTEYSTEYRVPPSFANSL